MADARSLTFTIAGDSRKLQASLDSAATSIQKTEGHLDKVGKTAKIAALGFVALEGARKAVDFLKDAAKEAIANEAALRRDGVAVKNAGENWSKLEKPVDDALAKMSMTSGFIKTDLQNSFAKLESVTHNHTTALKLENDAMNISAQRGISLASSTKALMMTYNGSSTAGRRLGVIVTALTTAHDRVKKKFEELAATQKGKLTPAQKDLEASQLKAATAADKQATSTTALDKIHKTFAGGVAARSKSLEGQLLIFQAKWNETKVKIGDVILPYLVKGLGFLMSAFDKLSTFVENNKTLMAALGIVIGVLVTGLVAYEVAVKAAEVAQKLWAVATGISTAAQWLWNAALDANPIGLLVVAIAALIAAGVLLYKNSETVRTVINGAWSDMKTVVKPIIDFFTETLFPAFSTAWDGIGKVVDTVVGLIKGYVKLGLDPVVGAINVVKDLLNGDFSQAWKDIKTTVGNVLGDIDTMLGGLPEKLLGYVKGVATSAGKIGGAIYDSITGALSGLGDAVLGLVKAGINTAIGALDAGFNVIHDHWPDIPGAPGPPFGHNPIPKLAAGGIVKARRGGTLAILGEGGRDEAVIPLTRGASSVGGQVFHIYTQGIDEQSLAAKMAFQARVAGASL